MSASYFGFKGSEREFQCKLHDFGKSVLTKMHGRACRTKRWVLPLSLPVRCWLPVSKGSQSCGQNQRTNQTQPKGKNDRINKHRTTGFWVQCSTSCQNWPKKQHGQNSASLGTAKNSSTLPVEVCTLRTSARRRVYTTADMVLPRIDQGLCFTASGVFKGGLTPKP